MGRAGRILSRVSGGEGVPGELFPYTRTVASYHRRRGALHAGNRGGFALHEALWLRVAGVSEPHVVQFPRLVSECEGCGAQSADHLDEQR